MINFIGIFYSLVLHDWEVESTHDYWKIYMKWSFNMGKVDKLKWISLKTRLPRDELL